MAGFLRQIREDEEGTLARLMAHRRDLVEPEIAEHRGRASSRSALTVSGPRLVGSATFPFTKTEPIDRAIADHVARLIPDRATIELGLGAIPQAVTRALGRKHEFPTPQGREFGA